MHSESFASFSNVLWWLCTVFSVILLVAPILKLVNLKIKSQNFEKVIMVCFIPFYGFLVLLNYYSIKYCLISKIVMYTLYLYNN